MPESSSKELEVSLRSWNSSDSIRSIPIKKRPLVVAKIPSLSSPTPHFPPEDHGTFHKKQKVSEMNVSDLGGQAQPAIEATSSIGNPLWRSIEESNINRDLSLAPRHVNSVRQNELRFGDKGIGGITQDDVADLGVVQENTDSLSALEGPFVQPTVDGGSDGKSVLSGNSSFLRVASMTKLQSAHNWRGGQFIHGHERTGTELYPPLLDSFGLPRNVRSRDRSTVKQDKMDQEPSRTEGHDCLQSNHSIDTANCCAKRLNWDLNTVMESWEGSMLDSTANPEAHEWQDEGVMDHNKYESVEMPPMRSDPTSTGCSLTTNDYNIKPTHSFSPTKNHDLSDAGLELQLRLPCRPELRLKCGTSSPYGKVGSEMSDLSLSLTSSSYMTEHRDIKPELDVERSQKNTKKVESGALKLVTLKQVKSELHEGMPLAKALETEAFGDPKSADSQNINQCTTAIKSEPLKDLSQDYLNNDLNSHASMLHRTEAIQEASESTVSSLLSNSLVSDGRKQDDAVEMSICTSTPMIGSAIFDKPQCLVSQSSIVDVNSSSCYDDTPSKTSILQNENIIAAEASDFVLDSLVLAKEKSETASFLSEYHLKSIISKCQEPLATNQSPEASTKTDCLTGDELNSCDYTALDELHVESYGIGLEAEMNEEKIGMSAEIQMESYENKPQLDNLFVAVGVGGTTPKLGGDDDYEDGEVRDIVGGGAIEGSGQQNEEKQVDDKKPPNTTASVNALIMVQSSLNEMDNKVLNYNKLKHDPDKNNKSASVPEAPTVEQPTSGTNSLIESTIDIGKENNPEVKLISSGGSVKCSQEKQCSQVVDAIGADLPAKCSAFSKTGSDGAKHGRVINLNVSRDSDSNEKRKNNLTRSISSHIGRESLVGKSSMQIKPHPQGSRLESCKERDRKFESERGQEQVIKRGSNMIHIRRAAGTRLDASCYDMDSESHCMLARHRNPPRSRSPRLERIPEFALDGSVGNVGCRMSTGGPKSSRLPFRRQSPVARGGIPLSAQISGRRVISPTGRCIGRDVPDPFLLAREEKMLRDMEDDMLDPRLLPHMRSRLEQPEEIPLQRSRRSLSPVQHRVPPLHLRRTCLESSPRSRFNSPHQLSPPGIRLERMRSPHRHPCFAEGIVVRRNGSPLHAPLLTNGARDMGPFREHDFLDSGRMLPRNIKRFDVNDPRGAERLAHNQFHDLEGSDECAHDRRHDERRGLFHPSREQSSVTETDVDRVRYHVKDSRPRPFRNCPEVNEGVLPDRGSPKVFDGPIRKRPGNIHCRLRGIEDQKGDHMYLGRQGWYDADLCDVRTKRSRF